MPNRKSFARSIVNSVPARSDGYNARSGGKWKLNEAPPLTDIQIKFLRALIEDNRLSVVCKWVGVSSQVLLRACAGFDNRLNPETMGLLRAFFAEADLEGARTRGEPGRDSPPKRSELTAHGKRKAANG